MTMIEIRNLNKFYNFKKSNELHVLKDFDLSITEGEMLAVMGVSGSGKSTLLNILGCIDDYQSGEYHLDDVLVTDLSDHALSKIRCEKIGFVFQDFALIEEESVLENVMTPLYFDQRIKHGEMRERSHEALKSLGIDDLFRKKVRTLSGGQKQRVAIARAVVNKPRLILADEPTGALDGQTSEEIMALFKQLNTENITIIIVTHDLHIAKQCQRIVHIQDGIAS